MGTPERHRRIMLGGASLRRGSKATAWAACSVALEGLSVTIWPQTVILARNTERACARFSRRADWEADDRRADDQGPIGSL